MLKPRQAKPHSCLEIPVYICDTDCYGIVWHGHYLRWLEMGRIQALCPEPYWHKATPEAANAHTPSEKNDATDWLLPVVDQTLKYKQTASYKDLLTVETWIEPKGFKLLCHQHILRGETLIMEGLTTCVVLDTKRRLQRRLPASILSLISR